MPADCHNKTIFYRAGIIFLLSMLLLSRSAVAQDGDTTTHTEEKVEPVVVRVIPDSLRSRWRNDRDFAYANDPEYWTWKRQNRQESPNKLERLLVNRWFGYTILFILGCV